MKKLMLAIFWAPLAALAQNYPSPTLNNVTIDGTLSVAGSPTFTSPINTASGGLGQNNGAANGVPVFSSGTAAVTAVTGSGHPVLDTSPVLVTPNLGTPSSVNLANGSNLPATGINYGSGIAILAGVSIPISLFGESSGSEYLSGGGISVSDSSAHAGHGHAAYSLASTPLGTGTSGPLNADFGFSVSLLKQNFGGSPNAGELDGGYVVVRNGGSNSDTTAFLFDVGNYGTGFNAAFEANTSAIPSGSITQEVNNQAAVVDTRTGNQFGYVVQKTQGVGGVAYYAAQGSGSWQHLLQFVGAGAIKFDMPIDSNSVVTMKLVDASNNSKTIRVNSDCLSVLDNAGTTQIFDLCDSGDLALSGGIVGVTSGRAANAGDVGELAQNTTSGTSLTSNTVTNFTSKNLAAGDWDIWGCVQFAPAGTTTIQALAVSVSTTSAALGSLGSLVQLNASFTTGQGDYMCTSPVPLNVSAPTPVYLTGYASFGVSTMSANGIIYARRN